MNLFAFALGISLLMAVLVYIDANKLKRNGLKITPLVWSLLAIISPFLALLFYLIMRYAVWKVQLKAMQEPSLQKRSSKVKIIRWSIILIIFILFSASAGCHMPFFAKLVHNKIKVGMAANDVVNILTKYKSGRNFHYYSIQLIEMGKVEECAKLKLDYDQCLKSYYSFECDKKFPKYRDDCLEGIYKPEEFVKIINDIAHRKVNYASYKAEISVLFMGPVFLHNSFRIYFDSNGKVASVTPVEHWD